MSLRTVAIACLVAVAAPALAQGPGKAKTFFRDGGWSGEIEALHWSGLDTAAASAVGRHSRKTAAEACDGRERREQPACIRQLTAEPEVRIFANCTEGVTWRDDGKWTFRLTDDAKAGKLRPLEDIAAWSEELSHRARWTAASWLGFLCPAKIKAWRLQDSG